MVMEDREKGGKTYSSMTGLVLGMTFLMTSWGQTKWCQKPQVIILYYFTLLSQDMELL